jgi:hypothetical protein
MRRIHILQFSAAIACAEVIHGLLPLFSIFSTQGRRLICGPEYMFA